ncbi:MAG: MaoC family dehydratase [Sphingomonadaceae bacterium]|nr:MaoC family dehydratase [Sphingobium sp.]MBP9159016.1 MaoC family dehydratase [Sphingobium sp.]MCC6481361.1 MaoC family dehydratase [Sphingomonadaceae bacterium]
MSAALHKLYATEDWVVHSPWVTVDQAMIDTFADATRDQQYIHVDPVRAAASPFGGTVAHGLLTLSLLPYLREQTPELHINVKMGINIGFDRIRYIHPVLSGSRVRANWCPVSIEEKAPGTFQCIDDVTVEIEGENRPAMIATWVMRFLF